MDAGDSSGGAGGRRGEAKRWLEIAERLLGARDLVGSKRFAERAVELDPLVDADRILAVSDVLIAAQSRRVGGHPDWYAVLQLEPPADLPDALRHFRRLSLLLRPPNLLPCADSAYGLVRDAWAVLSDPARKARFDAELRPRPSDRPAGAAHFWTGCPTCWRVHQYDRAHLGRTLRCPSCRRAFTAAEMAAPPAVVPGTEMYYCTWGFFPMGPPGVPHPQFPPPRPPSDRSHLPQMDGSDGNVGPPGDEDGGRKPVQASPKKGKGLKKVVAVKRVGGGFKQSYHGAENEASEWEGRQTKAKQPVVIDINEEVDINQEVAGGMDGPDVDLTSFDIDIDVDNLPNLSFFKEDDIKIQLH